MLLQHPIVQHGLEPRFPADFVVILAQGRLPGFLEPLDLLSAGALEPESAVAGVQNPFTPGRYPLPVPLGADDGHHKAHRHQ